MGKIVKEGGNGKKVELGKDITCIMAQPRGWGTSCKILVLKADGYFHCNDCGLVFNGLELKLDLKGKSTPIAIKVKCKCKELTNQIEWVYEEFFGYECPHGYYVCKRCKRSYEAPHYDHEAPLRVQESQAAKEHVKRRRKDEQEEREKRINRAKEDLNDLKEELRQLPRSEQRRLLKELSA